jgi:hypothetical protein
MQLRIVALFLNLSGKPRLVESPAAIGDIRIGVKSAV